MSTDSILSNVRALVDTLLTWWLAAVGLSVGSFLNVVIARLPHGQSVVKPRSRCPHCGHQLPWYQNIPVLSWLMLRGRCAGCKAPISPRYIFVELLTGALFLAAASRYGFNWTLVSALVCLCLVVPLIFIDAEHWILPFELTLPAIAMGILLALPLGLSAVEFATVGALAGFVAFRALEWVGWWVTGREALGAGDKYLLAAIGTQVGWKALFVVILFSSLQGAVVGLIRLRLTGRAGPAASNPEADVEEASPSSREPLTPAFTAPGLAWWKRIALFPYTVFLQDIPDAPPPDEDTGSEAEWQPQANNLPFGPWIGLAGIEVMLLGPWLTRALAETPWGVTAELLLGN